MNEAHLHLVLVHFPVVLIPVGTIILGYGLAFKNRTVCKVAYSLFILAFLTGVSAFLSGEGAEEVVEDMAGIFERLIHNHEESGELALWFIVALGVLSALNFISEKLPPVLGKMLPPATFLLSLAAGCLVGITAQKGGMIRHPEAFTQQELAAAQQGGEHEGDDD